MEAQFLAVIAADHASDLLETNPSPLPPGKQLGLFTCTVSFYPKKKHLDLRQKSTEILIMFPPKILASQGHKAVELG